MNLSKWFKQNKWQIITATCLIITAIFIIGLLLFPEIFYDQFIWKYFYGPILSDGLNKQITYQGISAAPKFTLVSELVYGLTVVIVLYGLYKLLKKWNIAVTFSFFIGVLPFILYGSIARVLEDAQLFSAPIVFWFVTPLIYFQTLILALLSLLIGVSIHHIKKITKRPPEQIMGICGTILLLPLIYYVGLWMTGSPWSQSEGLYPSVFVLVSLISIGITSAVFLIARYIQPYWKDAVVFTLPLNLSMIFGHQLDGIASYISIYDPLHMGLPIYIEKHPASDWLMQLWPPLFPLVKFLLIIIIIYIFDLVYKDELNGQRQLVNLLKIGIFILGFAPGFRDLLRVAMGV